MSSDPSSSSSPARIEVCEKHGLRYNAAIEEGCARCRTESGGRAMAPRGFEAAQRPDVGRSLLVAALMVVVVGVALFAVHTVAYQVGSAAFQAFEESPDEAMDDELIDELEDDWPFD